MDGKMRSEENVMQEIVVVVKGCQSGGLRETKVGFRRKRAEEEKVQLLRRFCSSGR